MAQYQVKLASTAYPLVFLMVDSADHVTGKTGLTPTVTISKAGAAFGSPSGAVSEIGSGWYKVAGNATDSGTLGALVLHATGTGADPTDVCYEVVAFDPQDAVKLGLTRVVANVDQIEGTDATDALDARITAAGLATATALATAQTSLNTIAGYIDTEVAAILAAVDTEVAAIKAKTDNLPSDPADQSQVEAAITAATSGLATAAKLLKYVQLLARKDAAIATDNATELTAINANGGSGAGAYANTTDSQEALRDRGDAAWTTGSSVLGSGSEAIRIRCLNGAAPVDGAAVWITTDSAGTNVVAGTVYTTGTGYTSTLMLDPGTYYVWRQANGVNFTNPETITVSDL